jgi:broad specificity phosphatase PhoE
LDPAVGEAVMCSHGELIGAALERLVGHDLDNEVEMAWPKGSTWVLDVDDGRLRQRHYLPPSASTTLRPATTRANTYWTGLSGRLAVIS